MSYPNDSRPAAPKDNRQMIYGLLIAALVLTWGYIIYDKSKAKEELSQSKTQTIVVSSQRDSVQAAFNDASAKLDSLTGSNVQLQGALSQRNAEISRIKAGISTILKKKDASDEDLAKARTLIGDLNNKIDSYTAEIARLKGENEQLATTNTQLTTEKKNVQDTLATALSENRDLSDKVDVASTLHASNINITAINVRKNGQQKETSSAKHTDLFTISCILDDNRITPSGNKTLYVSVYNPDGTPSGSTGNFTTRDGNTQFYTDKVSVVYEQGKSLQVNFNWKPENKFQTGNYRIEIFNNGFKIGEGRKTLKSSGFLGL